MAVTGFYVVWTFFRLAPSSPVGDVLAAAREHCGKPWAAVQATLGQHMNVEKYCTWGPYVAQLLTSGLGLAQQQILLGRWAAG